MARIETMKPEMTDRRYQLLSMFNELSQERRLENGAPMPIRVSDIHVYVGFNGSLGYPLDLIVEAIKQIDAEYIETRCNEIKRKLNKNGN